MLAGVVPRGDSRLPEPLAAGDEADWVASCSWRAAAAAWQLLACAVACCAAQAGQS
jgi:hypothetical protein